MDAQNVAQIGAAGGRVSQIAPNPSTTTAGANPLFGRPAWTYVQTIAGPVRGPTPHLARGSGATGPNALPGNAAQLPGYLSDNEYRPSTFAYDPINSPSFLGHVPRTINTGTDGRDLVGTYQPHDSTPGTRFNHHMRQAANWQVMEYPPDFRNLLQWQQVQKYRVQSLTLSARPLDSANYFLGYQVNPQIAAAIGQGGIGYMGG